MAKKEVLKNEEKASRMLYCRLINEWTMKIVMSDSGGTNLSSSLKFDFFWEFEFV